MLTNIPETDYLILQQMNDEDLVQYCQTSEYARELCLIPNIRKRLNAYKAFLTFNLQDIGNYPFKQPMMICKIEKYNTDQYLLFYEIYIIKNNYTVIDYSADTKDDEGSMQIGITHPLEIDFNAIFEQNNETTWDYDINTIYDILIQKGLDKYAKTYLINHLDNTMNSLILDNTIEEFTDIMGLFYWLKSQCMFLKLVDETIQVDEREFDLDYIHSEEGSDLRSKIIESINLYYDLLINYIYNF